MVEVEYGNPSIPASDREDTAMNDTKNLLFFDLRGSSLKMKSTETTSTNLTESQQHSQKEGTKNINYCWRQ